MTDETPSTRTRLDDTDLTLEVPADDVRGRKVIDRNGDEVGDVDGLIIDEEQRRVRFLEVGSGGFLGLGEKKQLVPRRRHYQHRGRYRPDLTDRTHTAGAPAYDPKVVQERRYYEDLYGYYGVPPFWTPGYTYPGSAAEPHQASISATTKPKGPCDGYV